MDTVKFSDTKAYIASFPKVIQQRLKEIRSIIKKAVPGGTEIIHYNMPAYKQTGILVWYAGCKTHIGFYPSGKPIQIFKAELNNYKTSKGAIQFPLDQPLPAELITKIVQSRHEEELAKSIIKTKKK